MLMGRFKDGFGNTARIEKETIIPYRGAKKPAYAYKLSLTADYDFDYLYHVSVHDTLDAALKEMSKCSGDTWKCSFLEADGDNVI